MSDENVLEIKLTGTGGASGGAGSGASTPQGGTRPGGSSQAPPPAPPQAPPSTGNGYGKFDGDGPEETKGIGEFLAAAAKAAREARDVAKQAAAQAERDRRVYANTGAAEDKSAYASSSERARQAQYDYREKADAYAEASQAAGAVQQQIDDQMAARAMAAREEEQRRREGERAAKAAEAKAAGIREEYAKGKAAEAKSAETAKAAAASAKEKADTVAASARNERRLMNMTLGAAGEQAAQGGAMNMIGAGMKAAGSGAFGEIAASMAGGPEAAAAMAAIQVAKAAVNAAVARGQDRAPYSAEIQGANALAGARDTMANIREADRMGGTYATLIDSQSRLENSAREAFDPVRDAIIQHITEFLETYADIAEDLQPIINVVMENQGMIIKAFTFVAMLPLKTVATLIGEMAEWFSDENSKKNTKEKDLFAGIDDAIKNIQRQSKKDLPAPAGNAAAGVPMGFPAWMGR